MTETESTGRPTGDGGRPSLLFPDSDAGPSSVGGSSRPSVRMLDAVDDGPSARRRTASRRLAALGVVGLGALALAGWWAFDGERSAADDVVARAPTPRAAPTPMPVTTLATAAPEPAAAAAPAAAEATAVHPQEPNPARIETVPAAVDTPSWPLARGDAATAPARPSTADASAGPFRELSRPNAPAGSVAPGPVSRPTVAERPRRPDAERPAHAKPTTTAAPPSRADERATRRPAAEPPPRTAAIEGDPDVALLSAMLARLSNDAAAASPGTIARLVEQCEARQTGTAIDAFECRRRVCVGHWGKVAACPTALAPRAN